MTFNGKIKAIKGIIESLEKNVDNLTSPAMIKVKGGVPEAYFQKLNETALHDIKDILRMK